MYEAKVSTAPVLDEEEISKLCARNEFVWKATKNIRAPHGHWILVRMHSWYAAWTYPQVGRTGFKQTHLLLRHSFCGSECLHTKKQVWGGIDFWLLHWALLHKAGKGYDLTQNYSCVTSPNICHRWCKLQVCWYSAGKQGPCLSKSLLGWPVLAIYRALFWHTPILPYEVSPAWKRAQMIGSHIKFRVSAGSTEPWC